MDRASAQLVPGVGVRQVAADLPTVLGMAFRPVVRTEDVGDGAERVDEAGLAHQVRVVVAVVVVEFDPRVPRGLGFAALGVLEGCLELDDRGLRLTRCRVLFGRRGPERVDWEIPLAALTRAREVTSKTPADHGGWNVRTVL